MTEWHARTQGIWLRILSGLIITLIVVALLYAGVIALMNLQRIGV